MAIKQRALRKRVNTASRLRSSCPYERIKPRVCSVNSRCADNNGGRASGWVGRVKVGRWEGGKVERGGTGEEGEGWAVVGWWTIVK
jgi:hypothetical protein